MQGSRRSFLTSAAAFGGLAALGGTRSLAASQTVEFPFANGVRSIATYPQKRPMILLTTRPVQLETPFSVFNESVFTPNDAFFVRWHLAGLPSQVDPLAFRLRVHGLVNRELSLRLSDLRKYEPVEVAAVCECSGNSRGYFSPRVAGGEWSNGAMGNALWRGVRLRDILEKAGVTARAVQVRMHGLERSVLTTTPAFLKALDMDLATSDDVIVAYEMNGAALPYLNGYPIRLIVPGYFATYWVKMLSDIEVLDHVDDNFWMKTAYRIPATPGGNVTPGSTGYPTVPIGKLSIRSFITSLADGAVIEPMPARVRGIAFNSGSGIKSVEFSADGGTTWSDAALGVDHGKFGFRKFTAPLAPKTGTSYALQSRATGNDGETQTYDAVWNPGGYLRNTIETVKVTAR